jgi:segregation and condensation protein A
MDETDEQLNFMEPLQVQLSTFEGPLELLLELVRKKKMDLADISLSEICEPYLKYLELMEEFDLDIAIEFLEIASTLILIKSRSLLPKIVDEEEEELDPEEELKRRLAEYMRYRELAEKLNQMEHLGREYFPRPPLETEEEEKAMIVFEEVSIYSLLRAYQNATARKKYHKLHEVSKDELPVEEKILQFMRYLNVGELYIFEHLLPDNVNRAEFVVSFMAILELAKLRLVKLHQIQQFGTLHCEPDQQIKIQLTYYENLWQKAS